MIKANIPDGVRQVDLELNVYYLETQSKLILNPDAAMGTLYNLEYKNQLTQGHLKLSHVTPSE